MKEEQDVFVSRHGRRTKVENVELGELNIEDQSTQTATTVKQANPRFKPIRDFHVPRPQMSKKKVAMISVVVLVCLLLPLAALELVALQYRAAGENLKKEVARIGRESALPLQKKTANATSMAKVLNELTVTTNKACRGGLLDNIAGIYPRSKSALDGCNVVKARANSVVTNLSHLQNIQRYNESVDAFLKPALATSDSPYAVLPDQVAAWKSVEEKLKKHDAPNELKTFHASLTQLSQDIATQWSALNTANNSQDKVAFDEAETKLGSFYESLRELSQSAVAVQKDIQTDLSTSLTELR